MGNTNDTPGADRGTVNEVSGRVKDNVIQSGKIDAVNISTSPVRPWMVVATFGAVAAIIAALVAVDYPRSNVASPEPPTHNPVPTSVAKTVNGPLAINSEWPVARGCPSLPSVVMPAGKPAIATFPADPSDTRQQMVAAGGAAWQQGTLYLNLSVSAGQQPVEILNIAPHIQPASREPAAWGYESEIGCGPDFDERIFTLNLDTRDFHDQGLSVDDPSDPNLKLAPSEPLGPTLQVTPTAPKTIRFDITACRANYTWYLEVDYAVQGSEHQYVRTLGPYRTFSLLASDAPVYTLNSPDGATYSFTSTTTSASDLIQMQCGQQ